MRIELSQFGDLPEKLVELSLFTDILNYVIKQPKNMVSLKQLQRHFADVSTGKFNQTLEWLVATQIEPKRPLVDVFIRKNRYIALITKARQRQLIAQR